jgi:opacity protein-like surface antigen
MKTANCKFIAALSALCLLSSSVSADWDDFEPRVSPQGFGGSRPQSFGQSNSSSNFSFQSFNNFEDLTLPESRGDITDSCEEGNLRWLGWLIATFGLSSRWASIEPEYPGGDSCILVP